MKAPTSKGTPSTTNTTRRRRGGKPVLSPALHSLLTEPSSVEAANAVVTQVGGEHYGKGTGVCPKCGFAGLQHWDLYAGAPYLEGTATKYITRWRMKGGVQDLRKAISVIEKIIAIEAVRQK